jgi:hypothetical protein
MHFMKRMLVLIPYRDREAHLREFLPSFQGFMAAHAAQIPYSICTIEQADSQLFNRGKLLNIGFDLYHSCADYVCYHDVDMLPESEACDYSYPDNPTQLALYLSRWNYEIRRPSGFDISKEYFGGVTLMKQEHVRLINGFSNGYWGWGAEDNDLYQRCLAKGLRFDHRPGRFFCLPHADQDQDDPLVKHNRERRKVKVASGMADMDEDGLNALHYTVLEEVVLSPGIRKVRVRL